MYRSVSSKSHKRDEVTHPVSAKLFGHSNSTFRGREGSAAQGSPSKRSHPPLSVPATGSYRLSCSTLREVPGPSALVNFKYTNRQATELRDIRLFKNLVHLLDGVTRVIDRARCERKSAATACGRAALPRFPQEAHLVLQRPQRCVASTPTARDPCGIAQQALRTG